MASDILAKLLGVIWFVMEGRECKTFGKTPGCPSMQSNLACMRGRRDRFYVIGAALSDRMSRLKYALSLRVELRVTNKSQILHTVLKQTYLNSIHDSLYPLIPFHQLNRQVNRDIKQTQDVPLLIPKAASPSRIHRGNLHRTSTGLTTLSSPSRPRQILIHRS